MHLVPNMPLQVLAVWSNKERKHHADHKFRPATLDETIKFFNPCAVFSGVYNPKTMAKIQRELAPGFINYDPIEHRLFVEDQREPTSFVPLHYLVRRRDTQNT